MSPKLLLFDNYDSFTYNIAHQLREIGVEYDLYRNDKIALEEVERYDNIILSPGPGIPSEAGILLPLIKEYASNKKILGICLGEQAIGEAFGANLTNLSKVYHGVETSIKIIHDDPLFSGLGSELMVGRYHSWVVDPEGFPDDLVITAVDSENGHIMALRHKTLPIHGVQFHPESIMTPEGKRMLQNWLVL